MKLIFIRVTFLLCMLGLKQISQWVRIITEKVTVVHLVTEYSAIWEPFTLRLQTHNKVLHKTQIGYEKTRNDGIQRRQQMEVNRPQFNSFHIRAFQEYLTLRKKNPQMHTHNICFITYYSLPTCFYRFYASPSG
jgi:hypothetical protein